MEIAVTEKPATVLEIFDFLGTPVFLIDRDLKIVSFNASAAGTYQYASGEGVGVDIRDVIPAWTELFTTPSPAAPEEGRGGNHGETASRKRNGETVAAKVTVVPCSGEARKLVIIQDISAQKKLQQRASQRAKELAVFNTFAKILARHTDTSRIMQETIYMLLYLMEADRGWIYLHDDASGELCLASHKGFSDAFLAEAGRLRPGECFSGKVFISGRPLLVKKASEDPRVVHRDHSIVSMAGVPITSKGTPLGVLGLGSRKFDHFTSLDTQLLTTIASELGVAIENAKLITQLREKMKEIELINELSGVLNSSLSIGTVFRIMMSEIRKLIEYDRGSILLYNEKEENLLIYALDTSMKTTLKRGVKAPLEGISAGWVIKTGNPWINDDLAAEVRFPLDRKLRDEGIRSTISIPLVQDKILGVFNLDSTERSKYSERDLHLLLSVSKHMSIALENAILFEEISREKKEWEGTFDAITDMVWVEDGRQRVLRANHALLTRCGCSLVELVGKQCAQVLDRIGVGPIECLCSSTISTKRPSFLELKGSGGNIFHFWAYPLVDEEGQLYAIVHYLKDVTSQKRLEQQLIRTDKLASLGTLVAGIAHEINNPLGIIAGYSEALLERAKDKSLLTEEAFEDFPEYLATIHNEMFRCKRILRTLLEFARPHGGTFRELDINELIKEVILLVNHKAAKLNHNIEFRLNRELPKIYADPGSLRQLFMNIIINSLYFTPEGGSIVITTGMDRPGQDSAFQQEGEMIAVSIADTGPGIPGEISAKIFDPFFTTKPVGDGTGLGLAICHKIVEEHGGTIDAESEEGNGTKFIIRLPAKTP
ncbi:MAG: GAF domain-containing protein [Nitrospirae bacterium]|nr:GAF domain-containing protein [Nitrospirota bacterium]